MNKKTEEFNMEDIRQRCLCPDQSSLMAANDQLYQLMIANPGNLQICLAYNEFRIVNISKLPKTRPHVLIGATIEPEFPNFHLVPLFEVADVMCITAAKKSLQFVSTIHCDPNTQFLEILNRLPEGFSPDLYWDQQIEQSHFIPAGIEKAPFPIVTGLCHTYLHKTIEHICTLFDYVVPISKSYGNLLKRKYPDKVLDIPFGLNWGSFEHFIKPNWEKSVDVCVTFSANTSPQYGEKRARIIELTKQFKLKYGSEFVIEIADALPSDAYFELLRKSRITINIVGIHGPYNYRTIEAMCAGSMLFQYEWDDHFLKNKFSELFVEGVHGGTFNFDNFEIKLLHYLRNPAITEKIAKEAYEFQKDNYNYKKLYLQLFEEVKKIPISLSRRALTLVEGYLQRDLAYYYQNNHLVKQINYGILNFSSFSQSPGSWIDYNNLMIYIGTVQIGSFGWSMIVAMATKMCNQFSKKTLADFYTHVYESALKIVPQEYAWIVKWNHFMIQTENHSVPRKHIEEMLEYLTSLSPVPFDENNIFFKYYINQSNIPTMHLGPYNQDYLTFNIDLLKNFDNPKERAMLYRNYAIKKIMDLLA